MSTKITLYYDDDIHFYTECFDEDHVHMKFNREADPVEVRVRLTTEQVVGLSKMVNIDSLRRQSNITDEQILNHVKGTVDARFKTTDFFGQFSGVLIYGSTEDPVENQIASGVAHYTKIRDRLKALVNALDDGKRRGTPLYFGLEDVF